MGNLSRTLDLPRSDRDAVALLEHIIRLDRAAIQTDEIVLGATVRDHLVEQGLDRRAFGDFQSVGEPAPLLLMAKTFMS